jgi:hypothetical protein
MSTTSSTSSPSRPSAPSIRSQINKRLLESGEYERYVLFFDFANVIGSPNLQSASLMKQDGQMKSERSQTVRSI